MHKIHSNKSKCKKKRKLLKNLTCVLLENFSCIMNVQHFLHQQNDKLEKPWECQHGNYFKFRMHVTHFKMLHAFFLALHATSGLYYEN